MSQTQPIGIIVAMPKESDTLRAALQHATAQTISGITFYSGVLEGQAVVLATAGVGKVAAAVCAEIMILTYHPRLILNSGVAGTLTPDLSIEQLAVADRVVQYDMDTSAVGDPVGMISGINRIYFPCDATVVSRLMQAAETCGMVAKTGTIATGDRFVADSETKAHIVSLFDAIAVEMEAGAIGHVCFLNDTPFGITRAISDGADEESTMDYPTFARRAAERSAQLICTFLRAEVGAI